MVRQAARWSIAAVVLACGTPLPVSAFAQTPAPPADAPKPDAAKAAAPPESIISKPMTRPPATPPAPPAPPAAAAPAAKSEDPLPIRRITLYRSGVGYFERSGQVSDDAEVQLRFATEQINDILKSLVLLDLSGGKVESVSYASKEPLAKRLASFGINIADSPSMQDILGRLRGTPVRLAGAEGEFSGTILNVEQRATLIPGGKDAPPGVQPLPWVNLLTDKGVRSVNLALVTEFEVLDKSLAEELNKALATLAEYRADRTKTVDLRFTGAGKRDVVVGYVHEMPVWKTSYRLVLPESDAGDPKGKLTLQGWAVVENTTDQDWHGVTLALVSGRPVSFQMDLYEPLFAGRPWAPVPTIPGVAPRIFALGLDAEQLEGGQAMGRTAQAMTLNSMQAEVSRADRGSGMSPFQSGGAPAAPAMRARAADDSVFLKKEAVSAQDMADYAAKAMAQGQSVGEVFQFVVGTPVSIERQRSAMIPIVTSAVTGRRVSIYNASDRSQYPMRGVELTNDSGVALLPGPVSVFDSGAYAGDAQIGQTPKADKRLLAYALDLDCPVTTRPTSKSTVTKVTIADGLFRQSVRDRTATAYEIANKDESRGRTVVIEHPRSPGYELVETEKPSELTPDLYRFTVKLDPKKATTFTVTQERTRWETFQVATFDADTVAVFQRDGKLSKAVADAFRTAVEKQSAINATERQIAAVGGQIDEIVQDQGRLRQNMSAVDKTNDLYRQYLATLTEQETRLRDLRGQKKSLQDQLTRQKEELAAYLKGLNVE